MKKFIIFALLIALLLAACSSGTPEPATTAKTVETTKAPESTEAIATTTEAVETTTEAVETTTEAIETTTELSLTKEAVDEYLNGAWDALTENFPDSSFSHLWFKGNLFIEMRVPPVDRFYSEWDSLDDGMKTEVLDYVYGLVSGEFAETLYNGIRERGGDDFTVYFTLVGEEVYCTSANLEILTNVFVR